MFVHHFGMHEFCCCEALKVFKITVKKVCENFAKICVKSLILKRGLKSCLKGFEKKEKKNQT
jgi:hypothetical protein